MSGTLDRDRRRFFGTAAATLAAVELAAIGSAHAQSGELQGELRGGPRANPSLGPLKQIAPGGLNVGYAEAGPAGGAPGILLHGWAHDIHSLVEVAPFLSAAGFKGVGPDLRGHGTTPSLA